MLWDYMEVVSLSIGTDEIDVTLLSSLIKKYASISASEAMCERDFKDLRDLLTGLRARTGDRLCNAIMISKLAPLLVKDRFRYNYIRPGSV